MKWSLLCIAAVAGCASNSDLFPSGDNDPSTPDGSATEYCSPGDTRACYPGDPNEVLSGGECREGTQTCAGAAEFGTWSMCTGAVTPTTEMCDDGVDSDCDGLDCPGDPLGPDVIDVAVSIRGDCTTASCPADHPYPVGCSFTVFGGGDDEDRGCIASTPTNSAVYFQAGNGCHNGYILGTLQCSDEPGAPLDQNSCPILKPDHRHVSSPDQCPELSD